MVASVTAVVEELGCDAGAEAVVGSAMVICEVIEESYGVYARRQC